MNRLALLAATARLLGSNFLVRRTRVYDTLWGPGRVMTAALLDIGFTIAYSDHEDWCGLPAIWFNDFPFHDERSVWNVTPVRPVQNPQDIAAIIQRSFRRRDES